MAEELVLVPKHLPIGRSWAGLTVFAAVRRAFPEVPPRDVFRKARRGELLRDGRTCDPLSALSEGEVVTVVLRRPRRHPRARPTLRDVPVETPAGPFWVVWEDPDLLAAGKPPECASHPGLKRSGDTLLDRIRAHWGVRRSDPFQPALANRLDIGTSGVVLAARTRTAQRRLGRLFQKGRVEKHYLALVAGWPEPGDGEIRRPLPRPVDSRDRKRLPPDHPRCREVLQGAVTRYRTLGRTETPCAAALLEVQLVTGRTHQIRRHLAGEGHPVAGDPRYGDPAFNEALAASGVGRMFLHAWKVCLPHPVTGERLELTAPVPEDMEQALRRLGAHPGEPPGIGG
ncbi:MAG: RluA family pseudouridine synthase [Deferrisomatales bacterium]|nr:RluA family pseudouridine synthase [Deferrisomatales bacterium]